MKALLFKDFKCLAKARIRGPTERIYQPQDQFIPYEEWTHSRDEVAFVRRLTKLERTWVTTRTETSRLHTAAAAGGLHAGSSPSVALAWQDLDVR